MHKPHGVTRRRIFSPVWIVPIVAGCIALYMLWQTLEEKGPEIFITFNSADGLVAGQTQIKYKAVSLGTVTGIALAEDHKKVLVKARMSKEAKNIITDKTRFWVVRPRLNYGSISGFETLVSGAYIQCDPGDEKGDFEEHFTGLEEPGVTIDEQGTSYTLIADKLGPINIGSPVYFRDVEVGQVSHYDLGDGFKPITIDIFIRAPYDKFVHKETLFWNASSLAFNMDSSGVQVQFQSLQSVVAGGISFSTGIKWKDTAQADSKTQYKLYPSKKVADIYDMKHVPFVTYVEGDAKSIGAGSSVLLDGIDVGEVTDVELQVNAAEHDAKVRVGFTMEPERIKLLGEVIDPQDAAKMLAECGMHARVDAGIILPTGGLSLTLPTESKKQNVMMEGDAIVIASDTSTSMDAIMANVSEITHKVAQIPFDQIGGNMNSTLESINRQSDMQRDVKQTLDQIGEAARSVRLLTDFLSHHPESLIRGRSDKDKGQ